MMPWLKSDDKMPRNDKVWDLSDAAYRLMDAGRHYAAEKLTNGWVPASRISSLTPKPATKKIIGELLKAKLWHLLPDVCESCLALRSKHRAGPIPKAGYIVHDYLRYNPSKIEWEERERGNVENGKKGAAARWRKPQEMAEAMALPIADAMALPIADAMAEAIANPMADPMAPGYGPYPVPRNPSSFEKTRTRSGELRSIAPLVDAIVKEARGAAN